MQLFELHFNPKSKEDQFFDSFIYEPENSLEKSLGSLYIIGELTNALPRNSNLLDNLSQTIKKSYYSRYLKNPGKALVEGLKKGNDFLSEEVKKENVSWLGNLNFAVLSLKDYYLKFSLTGNLKILLIRSGQIHDIGQNLNTQEIEPYPLKIFFNIVSGKLIENDIILVLTKNIFDFFKEEKILERISTAEEINEKKLKEIIPSRLFEKTKENFVSGICFLAVLKKEEFPKKPYHNLSKKVREIVFKKSKESFFSLFLKRIKKNLSLVAFFKKLNFLKKIGLKEKKLAKIKSAPFVREKKEKSLCLSFFGLTKNKISRDNEIKKKIILLIALVIMLFFGFLFFEKKEEFKKEKIKNFLNEIEQKLNQAEVLIKNNDNENAKILLKEIWREILPISQDKDYLEEKAISLKKSIEEKMLLLNKMEVLENPEIFLEIDSSKIGFIPQNISYSNLNLYFFSPVSNNLFNYNLSTGEEKLIKGNRNIELSDDSSEILLFFSKPNRIIFLKNGELKEKQISNLSPDSDFILFNVYFSNLYFLNKKNEIVKYPFISSLEELNWDFPKIIIKPERKIKSIAIDGFIWLLNEKNSIDCYYKKSYEKSLAIDIFPEPKNFNKIKTRPGLPYLYISEAVNNRLIVIDKNGQIIKQFQSPKFNNIKDFSISENGEKIWLLNGYQVYQIEL